MAVAGQFVESADLFFRIYRIQEKNNDLAGMSATASNLSNVFYFMGDYDRSDEYNRMSFELDRRLNNKSGMAGSLSNIGINWEMREPGNYDSALTYFNRAYTLFEEAGDSSGMSRVMINMGTVYGKQGFSEEALVYYKSACTLVEMARNEEQYSYLYTNIASSYREIEELDSAINYFNLALAMNPPIDARIALYEEMATIYADLGEADSVEFYYQLLLKLNNEFYNSGQLEKVKTIAAQYESEKLAREKAEALAVASNRMSFIIALISVFIVLLGLIFFNYRQRKSREAQRRSELEQKALRAQMNPHFIFNSLQAIQDMYVNGETDLANNYMGNFGELMRKILDNSDKEVISVKEELDTLKLYLELECARNSGVLSYSIDPDEHIDLFNTYVPPLVIQPFVENAIWHGILPKREKGKIEIRLRLPEKSEKRNALICTVTDDGVGMKKKGNSERHEPKGINLTEQRLGTPVEIVALEQGTAVTLTIPTKPKGKRSK